MTTIDLDPDAPHSPDRTRALADTAAGIIRALNYATTAERGGLHYPGDVYDLLGTLGLLAGRLPQLCQQMSTWLDREQHAGRLGETSGGRYGGDSRKAVTAAGSALTEAARAADRLTSLLGDAQAAIAGVEYVVFDDEDPDESRFQ